MIINSISLRNFKSHLDTKICLSSGITAILGDPQNGKSNILKALDFISNHKPTRFDKVSSNLNGDNIVNVTLDVQTNNSNMPISLTKTDTSTEYQIASADPYSTVGTSVPEPVRNILNLSDLYMQGQIDEPFLITSSAGEVSRTINKIIHLDEINKWIKNITSKFNSKNNELKVVEKDCLGLDDKIKSYDFIDSVDEKVLQAEDLHLMRNDLIIRYERLYHVSKSYQKIDDDITDESIKMGAIKDGLKEIKALKSGYSNHKDIFDTIDSYLSNKKELAQERKNNKFTSDKLLKINSLVDKIHHLADIESGIYNALESMDSKTKEVRKITRIKKDYNEILIDMKVCPTCKTKITGRRIEIIMEKL